MTLVEKLKTLTLLVVILIFFAIMSPPQVLANSTFPSQCTSNFTLSSDRIIHSNLTAIQIKNWINNETTHVRSLDAKNDAFYSPLNIVTHGFNTEKIALNFTNIEPQNLTKEIEMQHPEDPLPLGNISIGDYPRVMSFRVPRICYLTSLEVKLNISVISGITIDWAIMNATGTIIQEQILPYPDTTLISNTTIMSISGTQYLQLNITIDPPLLLDTSKTYDNTFFLHLYARALTASEDVCWLAYNDSTPAASTDGVDEGYAYYYDSDSNSFIPEDVDYFLQYVHLSPLLTSFQDYELKVNNISVNENGTWTFTNLITEDPVILNVTASWLLKFNITCETTHLKEELLHTSCFINTNYDNVTWYVNSTYTFPSGYLNCSTKFHVPSDWTLQNNTNNVIDRQENLITVNMSDPWFLIFQGINYIKSLDHPANVTINHKIEFSVQWKSTVTVSNGNLTMAIYNVTDVKIHEETKNISEGSNFTWIPQNVEKGEYKVAILFYNGTEIGYRISTFSVFYTIKIIVENLSEYYLLGENITIKVRCVDGITGENITDANIYGKWIKGTIQFTYNNITNCYEGIVGTNGLTEGMYNVSIYVIKEYYEETHVNITLNLIYPIPTRIILEAPSKASVGKNIGIEITLTDINGTGVPGKELILMLKFTSLNGTTREWNETLVTNNEGKAFYNFKMQTAGNLTIIVYFNGSREYLPSQSEEKTIEITPYLSLAPILEKVKENVKQYFKELIFLFLFFFSSSVYFVHRKKSIAKLINEIEHLSSISSIEEILLVEKRSGLPVRDVKIFGGEERSPELIAGFIQAVQTFYTELSNGKVGYLDEISYGDPEPRFLTCSSGEHTYTIAISTEKLKNKEIIREITQKFEEKFKDVFNNWRGDLGVFNGTEEIIYEIFGKENLAMYKIEDSRKIPSSLKEIIQKISNQDQFFYMPKLAKELEKLPKSERIKLYKTVLKLKENKELLIIYPQHSKHETEVSKISENTSEA